MNDFPSGLLYLILFTAVIFGQYLMQRLRRERERRQDDAQLNSQQQAQIPATEVLPAIRVPGPVQFVLHPHPELATHPEKSYGSAMPERAPIRVPRRYSREALFGNRRRTQDAVVASVILGPCRAYLPHDS